MASYLIHKLFVNYKMKLLYDEQELFSATTELLNFKMTLPLSKLDMDASRLESSGFKFSMDILVNT